MLTSVVPETHVAFIYRSKVHTTLSDYRRRATCSQKIQYMGPGYLMESWHTSDQCKRCFKGV